MALTVNHPTLKEVNVSCHSSSIGASPAAAYARAPFRGTIVKVAGIAGGVISTADSVVVVKVGSTTVTGAAITITVSGAAAGQIFTATPSGANTVNEDDVISFTPSGSAAASIPGTFIATIQTS